VELTIEQRDLRDAVRGLLARHHQMGAAEPGAGGEPRVGAEPGAGGERGEPGVGDGPGSGYDVLLWQRLCGEIGVAGLAVPDRYGGAGAGLVETCIVTEELGRSLVSSPMLGSAVLAGHALLASGDEQACQRLLPGIASGATVAALAWAPQAGHWDPAGPAFAARQAGPTASAHPDEPLPRDVGPLRPINPSRAGGTSEGGSGHGWVLTGEAHHVLDGDTAGVLLAAATTPDGTGLFAVDPEHPAVSRRPVTTMDTTRRLAVVTLEGAPGRCLGPGAGTRALARARDLACVALAAEQVGAAQRALELTVAYTKTRVQFGRPIGSFQALQHRMADLHVLVESARSLCYAAAAADDDADPGADSARLGMLAAAAKAYCSQALTRAAGQMIQMHGAIGITWEHDAHRYFKRAHGAGQLLGRPEEHVARIAAALIDG
jgi:alkylation response protein AidB-like acyl-CoA dehydrogenase